MSVSVVTGGAGFIGSNLVDRLIELGDRVVVVDTLASGRLENLAQAQSNGDVEFHQSDIVDSARMEELFQNADRVFHLAGLADIVPSIEDPLEYFRVNASGTASVMQAAHRSGVPRVIYAASASCYGIPEVYPTTEEGPTRPQYPYALTKYLGEQTVLHWGSVYGIDVVSLRLFNAYGPRSRTTGAYGAVFGVFLAQRNAGKPLTIVGDGTQTRDFTFVSDVVEAFVTAGNSDVSGEVMNVGSGESVSVNRLAALIGGKTIEVPKRPGEPDVTFADISKIKRLLGWEPQVKIEDGVSQVLNRIDDWSEAPVWSKDDIEEATKVWFDVLGRTDQ